MTFWSISIESMCTFMLYWGWVLTSTLGEQMYYLVCSYTPHMCPPRNLSTFIKKKFMLHICCLRAYYPTVIVFIVFLLLLIKYYFLILIEFIFYWLNKNNLYDIVCLQIYHRKTFWLYYIHSLFYLNSTKLRLYPPLIKIIVLL